ncbi:MAG: APC family permease [Bacillota bacterium]|nr:APC family permease [Bacillota bacterium]
MVTELKRILIGKPLKNIDLKDEKYSIRWGLPILSSDAISSVAYAGEEMLKVMIPVIGLLSYHYVLYLSLAIIGLLTLLMLSYRQTIECYPNGGGAYIVAKENLGVFAGVTAGAALSIDYIMTVAVSVSSGVDQISSAFSGLRPYVVPLSVVLVLLLMIGNLRGIRESSKFFGLPAYLFIFAVLSMIIAGFYKYLTDAPIPTPEVSNGYYGTVNTVNLILILRAFSNGCTALTGVEAVSNAVPNFKEPSTKNARTVLLLLSLIILLLFGGTSILANIYHATPGDGQQTMLVQMADMIYGRATIFNSIMFYFITSMLFIILVLAANTAFSGFPMLVSVMASEGFVPRQLKMRGDRLSYSNGIIILSVVASILIIIFNAQVTKLMGLYAVGVFISFTLSQTGMILRWFKTKGANWHYKALVNGAGALVTGIAVIIIGITKFHEGAWIVVLLIPIMIYAMLKVKKHYVALAKQLKIKPEEYGMIDVSHDNYRNRIIVPIESINKSSIRALRYARTISNNVSAFSVAIDEESEKKIKEAYSKLRTDIPLTVVNSPFRKVVDPLLDFIKSAEYNYQPGDIITVILPQFSVNKWWQKLLHNGTRVYIERQLLKHKHIVVATIPLQLKDDDNVLNSPEFNPMHDNPWTL